MKRLTSIFQGKRRGPKKTPWSFVTSQLFFTSFGSDPTAQAARPRTARRPGRACGAWLSKLKRQVSKPKAISSSMGQASGAILELGQLGRAQSTLISPPVTVRVARSSTILYPASGVQGDRHIYIYIIHVFIYTYIYLCGIPAGSFYSASRGLGVLLPSLIAWSQQFRFACYASFNAFPALPLCLWFSTKSKALWRNSSATKHALPWNRLWPKSHHRVEKMSKVSIIQAKWCGFRSNVQLGGHVMSMSEYVATSSQKLLLTRASLLATRALLY